MAGIGHDASLAVVMPVEVVEVVEVTSLF